MDKAMAKTDRGSSRRTLTERRGEARRLSCRNPGGLYLVATRIAGAGWLDHPRLYCAMSMSCYPTE